jgi:hypothetical protein
MLGLQTHFTNNNNNNNNNNNKKKKKLQIDVAQHD